MRANRADNDDALSGLAQRWAALCARISPAAPPETAAALFAAIDALYRTPPRGYHNLNHVATCLTQLDAARNDAADSHAVEWALWLHDAIYIPGRPDNETRSAALAAALAASVGANTAFQDTVRSLVLATTHRDPPRTADEELIVDIDLAGLAAAPEAYDRDAAAIRDEYGFVEDAAFADGRRKFLEGLLARPHLYHTPAFRNRCEAAARAMARAIAELKA